MPRLKPQLTKFGGASVSFFYTGYRKTVTQFTLFALARQLILQPWKSSRFPSNEGTAAPLFPALGMNNASKYEIHHRQAKR